MTRHFLFLFCTLWLAGAVHAESQATLSPLVYKKVQKAEKLIAEKSYSQAEQTLSALLKDVDADGLEYATIMRSLSSIHTLRGHYPMAANMLDKVVRLNVLLPEQQQEALLSLGQLWMASGQYDKAIEILETWLKNNQPDDIQIYVLLANAHAQLHHYRQALPYIEKAIAKSSAPKPAWYQLNLALYYELENYRAAAKLLQRLIQLEQNNKDYWQQLVTVYQQLKQYPKAAAVKYLGFKKDLFNSEKDILELSNLYLYIGAPYKSGVLLKNQIKNGGIKSTSKNWETLSNAWLMAKEFDLAVEALETASQLNDKGSLYEQLGQIYVEQEKWQLAINALTQAISKGGLKDPGAAHFLLAVCYYELNQFSSAQKQFMLAQKYASRKKDAGLWLEYIQNQNRQKNES